MGSMLEIMIQVAELPCEVVLSIILKSDCTTIARCRTLSRKWNASLAIRELLVNKFVIPSSWTCIMQLENPLIPDRLNQIVLADIDRVFFLPVPYPTNWQWFDVIGASSGHVCARYSMDGMNSEIIVWNPLTRSKRVVGDPGSKKFILNKYAREMAIYAFVPIPISNEFGLVLLLRDSLFDSRYELYIFNSLYDSWCRPSDVTPNRYLHTCIPYPIVIGWHIFWLNNIGHFGTISDSMVGFCLGSGAMAQRCWPPMRHTYINPRLVVDGNRLFIFSIHRSIWRGYIHVQHVMVEDYFDSEWRFERGLDWEIGEDYLTECPTIMCNDSVLGIRQSIMDFDIDDPGYQMAQFEIRLAKINVNNGSIFEVGILRYNSMVFVKSVFNYVFSEFPLAGSVYY